MPKRIDAGDDVEEIFTDLTGNPDEGDLPTTVIDRDDENRLTEQPEQRRRVRQDEAELEIVDEPGEDELEEEIVPVEEPPAEPEMETVLLSDYDPKDYQILARDAQLLKERETNATQAKTDAEATIKTLEASLAAAKEAGNTKDEVAATLAIGRAMQAQSNAQNMLDAVAQERTNIQSRYDALKAKAEKDAAGNPLWDKKPEPVTRPKAGGARQPGAGPSKLFTGWVKHNGWFNDPKFAPQREFLAGIDRAMAAEGKIKKDDPAYFAEMGQRFNRQYPGIFKSVEGKPVATGQRVRGGAQGAKGRGIPVPSSTTPSSRQQGNVRLTTQDVEQMRTFGLDPDDMNVRRSWLTEKRALGAGRG